MSDPDKQQVNPWVPMLSPIDLKHLGKLVEELGEAQAACARCIIQGIDECEPETGKSNREWLEEELADVRANIGLVIQHFVLNSERITNRVIAKRKKLTIWHQMLNKKAV